MCVTVYQTHTLPLPKRVDADDLVAPACPTTQRCPPRPAGRAQFNSSPWTWTGGSTDGRTALLPGCAWPWEPTRARKQAPPASPSQAARPRSIKKRGQTPADSRPMSTGGGAAGAPARRRVRAEVEAWKLGAWEAGRGLADKRGRLAASHRRRGVICCWLLLIVRPSSQSCSQLSCMSMDGWMDNPILISKSSSVPRKCTQTRSTSLPRGTRGFQRAF